MSGPVRLYPALLARGTGEKPVSVSVGADPNRLGEWLAAVFNDLKDDALPLPEGSKDRSLQRTGLEENL